MSPLELPGRLEDPRRLRLGKKLRVIGLSAGSLCPPRRPERFAMAWPDWIGLGLAASSAEQLIRRGAWST